MELEHLYYASQLVASVALVVSLLFVGFQMRQNANALRVSVTAGGVANWQENLLAMASSEFIAPAFARVNAAARPEEVELDDIVRTACFLIASAKNTEFAYYRHQANEIRDGLWEAARNALLEDGLWSPMVREVVWPRVKSHLSVEFASHMEELLRTHPAGLPLAAPPQA